MAYVVRFSTTIEKDIELNFSCYMGDLGSDIADALETDGFDLEALEARYERFGGCYDSFDEYLREVVLDESNLIWDERFEAYRSFHHSGLSCWALEAETEADALVEAVDASKRSMELAEYTIGAVRIVAEISENVYLLECDAYAHES